MVLYFRKSVAEFCRIPNSIAPAVTPWRPRRAAAHEILWYLTIIAEARGAP